MKRLRKKEIDKNLTISLDAIEKSSKIEVIKIPENDD